jgi:hypothetical protein
MTEQKSDAPDLSTIKGRGSLEVGGSVAAPAGEDRKVKKVIVAVHGVGDQYNFATIQSVVNQFCRFHGEPAAVPLGRFHGKPRFSISPPFPEGTFDHLAFAEVYWAKVPREVAGEQHTIEEAKKWAGTLVERLRLGWHLSGERQGYLNADYDRIRLVVEEMIQTLAVLERLSFLAAQAGLFTFNLKKLLENYLGDVQIVTEFDSARETILDAFKTTMVEVSTAYPQADVYIIAHSEGTVVSLLGLLDAGRQDQPPDWLGQVAGFMTIGSPIDKHLILWPTLFAGTPPSPNCNPRRIEWRNYYDRGDPIGFNLNGIRHWIGTTGWDRVFNFSSDHDFGFVRYPFPGKAHVDYWDDPEVFGHFIETVVKEPLPAGRRRNGHASHKERKPPATRHLKEALSFVIPYLGVTALLVIGVYLLYRAVDAAFKPAEAMGLNSAFHLVSGVSLLVLGMTVAARVPRLTRDTRARFLGAAAAIILAVTGILIGEGMGEGMGAGLGFITKVPSIVYFTAVVLLIVLTLLTTAAWPFLGLKPLIVFGTATLAAFVGFGLYQLTDELRGAVWPVLVALAAFLYLWWLAALILDLVLIWHLVVHSQSRVPESLARMAGVAGQVQGAV